MKSIYKISLALSTLLILVEVLPAFSLSIGSNSQNKSQFANSQNILLAGTGRWRRKQAPRWGLFAARRGPCLSEGSTEIIPLIPPDPQDEVSKCFTYHKSVWNSTTSYPTLFFYVPQNNITRGELTLQNEEGKTLYTAFLELPAKAGIVSVKLPEFLSNGSAFPPLEVNQSYGWIVRLYFNGDFPEIGGGIHRLDSRNIPADSESNTSVTLEQSINQAKPEDLPKVYEKANIWYDTLDSLAELMESKPDSPKLKQQWHNLLVDVGYKNIADTPLVGSAKVVGVEIPEE